MMAEEFWRRGRVRCAAREFLPPLVWEGAEAGAAERKVISWDRLGKKGGQFPSQKGLSFFVTSMCCTQSDSHLSSVQVETAHVGE
jgi:hypothetical protein